MTDVTQQVTAIIAGIRGHKPERCTPHQCQCRAAAEEIIQLLRQPAEKLSRKEPQ